MTSKEIHAFLIGYFESLCPWKAYYHDKLPLPSPLKGEEHYYFAGRSAGFITLLLILVGIAKLVQVLLL
jgi:hypothetical protein